MCVCEGAFTPVHGGEELLQVVRVHVGLAELQLGPRVVVHVVDAHLIHDAEAPLRSKHIDAVAVDASDALLLCF